MTTGLRTIQEGQGERRTVVIVYLLEPSMDQVIRAALGPNPCILARSDDGTDVNVAPQITVFSTAIRIGFKLDGVVLAGWSLGCAGIRRVLQAHTIDEHIRGLVLCDGIHASMPPKHAELDPWRSWFDLAKRGHVVVAASHTYQTYMERLDPAAPPYASTVTVLRALTGLPLHEPRHAFDRHRVGGLVVESMRSNASDTKAHQRQQSEVLPALLADFIRPLADKPSVGAAQVLGG